MKIFSRPASKSPRLPRACLRRPFPRFRTPPWDEIVSCGGELRHLGCSLVILTHVVTPDFFTAAAGESRQQAEPRLAHQRRQLDAQGLKGVGEAPIGCAGASR